MNKLLIIAAALATYTLAEPAQADATPSLSCIQLHDNCYDDCDARYPQIWLNYLLRDAGWDACLKECSRRYRICTGLIMPGESTPIPEPANRWAIF